MDKLSVFCHEAQQLCSTCALAIIESCCNVEDGFTFCKIMFACRESDTSLLGICFGEVANRWDLDGHLFKREILARRYASTKGNETWCGEIFCSFFERVAFPNLRFMRYDVFELD